MGPIWKAAFELRKLGSLKAGVTACAFYQPVGKLTQFISTSPKHEQPSKCFITLSRLECLDLFLVPSLGVGCASELTITTDKNTECYWDICHGCLLFQDEMADWKTHWQWVLWCFRCIVICYERRVSIYYIFGACWHRGRGFDVGRCQRFRLALKQFSHHSRSFFI